MLDIGDPLPFAIEVRNSSGVLTNSTDGTLTINLPDATPVVSGLTNPSTGVYEPTYVPTQAGRHDWVYASTNPQTRQTGVFNVAPARAEGILSLTEARAHLNRTSTGDDEEIREMIEAVTSLIEDGDGQDWPGIGPVVRRTVVERVSGSGKMLLLSTVPIISITSIAAAVTGGGTYTAADLTVDTATGMVRYLSGADFVGYDVNVTYTAGRTVVPPSVILAAKIVLKHMWETQRGPGPAAIAQGEEEVVAGAGFTIPNRALSLLGSRRRAPAIA